MTLRWFSFAGLIVLIVASGKVLIAAPEPAPAIAPAAPKWEYQHLLDGPDSNQLNVEGAKGWELVSVVGRAQNTNDYYFKRAK